MPRPLPCQRRHDTADDGKCHWTVSTVCCKVCPIWINPPTKDLSRCVFHMLLPLPLPFRCRWHGNARQGDLVIQGRAAQALHCSAMLFMVSDELYNAATSLWPTVTGRRARRS